MTDVGTMDGWQPIRGNNSFSKKPIRKDPPRKPPTSGYQPDRNKSPTKPPPKAE